MVRSLIIAVEEEVNCFRDCIAHLESLITFEEVDLLSMRKASRRRVGDEVGLLRNLGLYIKDNLCSGM